VKEEHLLNMDRTGNECDKRVKDTPWRVRDGGKEEDNHSSDKHNPMIQIRPVDVL
jgi:hypothetical protein